MTFALLISMLLSAQPDATDPAPLSPEEQREVSDHLQTKVAFFGVDLLASAAIGGGGYRLHDSGFNAFGGVVAGAMLGTALDFLWDDFYYHGYGSRPNL